MDPRTHAAITWLLNCGEPAIRLMTRRDVLGEQAGEDAGQVLAGAKVTALLSGQQPGGGFGVHPYRKWTGAHWRLVSCSASRFGFLPRNVDRGHIKQRRFTSNLGWAMESPYHPSLHPHQRPLLVLPIGPFANQDQVPTPEDGRRSFRS